MPQKSTLSEAPTGQSSEEELIRRVRNGEHECFYELIRPYERRIFATALAILRNEPDAEDVAQEAALKAFKNLREFREESRFSTWLTAITINEARMRRRKNHADIMESIAERKDEGGNYTPRDIADWHEIPLESLERKEIRQKLAAALGLLSEKYREVFVLRDMQHLSITGTANVLGITEAAVKVRLLRARLMLRDLLPRGLGNHRDSRLSLAQKDAMP